MISPASFAAASLLSTTINAFFINVSSSSLHADVQAPTPMNNYKIL